MLNEGKMRCGGCGCDRHSQHICRCAFFRSTDCSGNQLQIKGPVVGTGIHPAGYTNTLPIKYIQESPCFWNLTIDGIIDNPQYSRGYCSSLNKNYILSRSDLSYFSDTIGNTSKHLGYFYPCNNIEDTSFIYDNLSIGGGARIFLAGDDYTFVGSGMYDGNADCPASSYFGTRPTIWMELNLATVGTPVHHNAETDNYGVPDNAHFYNNRWFYSKSNVVYNGDYNVPSWGQLAIPSPDCNIYVNTGDINGHELDITFSGFSFEEDSNQYFSGCHPCSFDNMTVRLTPYTNYIDYYDGQEISTSRGYIPYSTQYNSEILDPRDGPTVLGYNLTSVSGGYQSFVITFSGVIAESDVIPSSEYRKSTCDCSFINGTFYQDTEFPASDDNRNRFSICCECPASGSPCINNARAFFTTYHPGGDALKAASKLRVEVTSSTFGLYAVYEKTFNNVASGDPLLTAQYWIPASMNISDFHNLDIPYVSGYSNQEKCDFTSSHCSITMLPALHTQCKQNGECGAFCDYKGPDELLVVLHPTFRINERIHVLRGYAEPKCTTSANDPAYCNYVLTSGVQYTPANMPFGTPSPGLWDYVYSDECSGGAPPWYSLNAAYTNSNCDLHLSLFNSEPTNYIVSKNATDGQKEVDGVPLSRGCVYVYENYGAQPWEIEKIIVRAAYDGFHTHVSYGSGSYYAQTIKDPTSDGFDNLFPCVRVANTFQFTHYTPYSGNGICNSTCFYNDVAYTGTKHFTDNGCYVNISGYLNIYGL